MPETDPNTNDESINESERIDPGGTAAAEGVLYHVRAWAEFAAEGEAQLALAEGDVLEVLHEANQDGWGYGYGSGCRTRVFPQRARAPVARARPAWSQGTARPAWSQGHRALPGHKGTAPCACAGASHGCRNAPERALTRRRVRRRKASTGEEGYFPVSHVEEQAPQPPLEVPALDVAAVRERAAAQAASGDQPSPQVMRNAGAAGEESERCTSTGGTWVQRLASCGYGLTFRV